MGTQHMDPPNPTLGISRRTVLRRGAVVGAGLVWATPLIQTIPRAAFAGTPVQEFHGISYVGFVFRCGAPPTTYRAKFETEPFPGGTWVDVSSVGSSQHQALPHCRKPTKWNHAKTVGLTGNVIPGVGAIQPHVEFVGGEPFQVIITLPAGCTALDGVAMGGLVCVDGVVGPQNVITFTAPDKKN